MNRSVNGWRRKFDAMGYKKLIRFKEVKSFTNVLEYPENINGRWGSHFKNNHPIVLELACGKGEYTTQLGRMQPDQNFIGVDIKGNRLWVGAKDALANRLQNVAFLRTQIDKIASYFDENEVKEIWITFPDPFLRLSKLKKRLTHPKFLRLYQQFLQPGGKIHLKTDSPDLYSFTKKVIELYGLQLIEDLPDLYAAANISPAQQIKTYYEILDIAGNRKVHYLSFILPGEIAEKDNQLKEYFFTQSTKSEHGQFS